MRIFGNIHIAALLTLGFFVTSAFAPIAGDQSVTAEKNAIVFFKIDNQAQILVNGEVVYDSGFIDEDPELNIEVDLNDFLVGDENNVVIRLLNGKCPYCLSNPWAINFEIYIDGESVDYIYESGEGKTEGGEVFTHVINWGSDEY